VIAVEALVFSASSYLKITCLLVFCYGGLSFPPLKLSVLVFLLAIISKTVLITRIASVPFLKHFRVQENLGILKLVLPTCNNNEETV
jgi:hypothetical protein